MPDEETGLWYFLLIIQDTGGQIYTEVGGPFYKEHLADRMMAARIEQLQDGYHGSGLRSILAVPPAQTIEISLINAATPL